MKDHTAGAGKLRQSRWLPGLLLLVFMVLETIAMWHHEMWADELHSWNIAKGSAGFFELIHNTRFEGHPPAWLALLWVISKFTHDPLYMQLAQLIIAVLTVYLILFHSRLPLWTTILLPFGYYFIFEYGVFSRNYGLGVLLAFLVCIVIQKEIRGKWFGYYLLLLLMSNVHLLALILAGSLHLYQLLSLKEKRNSGKTISIHILAGALIFMPAVWFIAMPSGSGQTIAILIGKTAMSRVLIFGQAPLRAFVPVPAWWKYQFWNTQVLMEWKDTYRVLKGVIPLLSVALLAWSCWLLKKSRKSLILLLTNTAITFAAGIIFSLHTERYVGYLFIGFIVAWWMYCNEVKPSGRQNKMVNVLLWMQLFAGLFSVSKDMIYPFSQAEKAKDLVSGLPAKAKIVTDYRALNATSAYLPQPLYCIDMEQTLSFILWNTDMERLQRYPYRYDHGLQQYFSHEGCKELFMISTGNPETLSLTDVQLFKQWNVQLVKSAEGAIEPESNLYLYRISRP